MKQSASFDVLVVGGGHAGVEAAAAASRMGCNVALITYDLSNVGALSCNPSVGGIGKGHLIREVDALDGVGGRAADAAAIHYRMLNRSKGRAVHGPRVQVDRQRFAQFVQDRISRDENIVVIPGEVVGLLISGSAVAGVRLGDGAQLAATAVVLATGTFLRAQMFRGDHKDAGGRLGERSATSLGEQLIGLGHVTGRMKTGTPPRLDGRTIDWARVTWQPSDDDRWTMSLAGQRLLPQVSCGITATTIQTHDIIAANASRSPLFTGEIVGDGPRYCPSIEDKVRRFSDRKGHQIFLEPEGLTTPTVYPNGISTSLPVDVQEEFIRSIPALERASITQWGYAVEYDYLDPRGLDHSLQSRTIRRLFCAGQINGTTGYEEAAAQGVVAGCNAAATALERSSLEVDRTNSYIGVLIDDLVLQGVSEPYRMLTARAEYRLSLRSDNADVRLGAAGLRIGCIGSDHAAILQRRVSQRRSIDEHLETLISPSALQRTGAIANSDGISRTAREWLRLPGVDARVVGFEQHQFDPDVLATAVEDARYLPYIVRQQSEIRAMRDDEAIPLSAELIYESIPGLSNEMVERLSMSRPPTLGAAGRIRGITPAALTALLLHVRRSG